MKFNILITKAFLFSIIFTLATPVSLISQTEGSDSLFTYIDRESLNLDSAQSASLDTMLLRNDAILNHNFVEVATLSTLQDTGNIPVNLPNSDSIEIFDGRDIEYHSDTSFTYYGELIECDGRVGYIQIISDGPSLFGQINLDGKAFELHDLGGNKNILVEIDTTIYSNFECGPYPDSIFVDSINNDSFTHDFNLAQTRSTGTCNIRVLVLYTEAAEKVGFPVSSAKLHISQTNQIAKNSNAQVNFVLAGVEKLENFSEVVDNSSLEKMQESKRSTMRKLVSSVYQEEENGIFIENEAHDLRNNDDIKADLVVLYTDGNWSYQPPSASNPITIIGYSNRDYYYIDEFAYCFVELDAAGGNFLFSHEVGHQIGCGHHNATFDNISDLSYYNEESAKAHNFLTGWFIFKKGRRTVVHQPDADGKEMIMHYSNPDIEFKDEKTGTQYRNNTKQINDFACHVASFRDYTPPLRIRISGPIFGDNSGTYTWCVQTNAGCNSITDITWEYSLDGFNYNDLLNDEECLVTQLPYDKNVYYKVTVVCENGETDVTFIYVYNEDSRDCSGPNPKFTTSTVNTQVENKLFLSPNPALDLLNVNINIHEKSDVQILIYDISGKLIRNVGTDSVGKGVFKKRIALYNMHTGYYILKVVVDTKAYTKAFIKS